MKDLFSGHAKVYAAFRPAYPQELYQFIFQHVKQFDAAWDCATGNGQVAQALSEKFKTVHATDISVQQLSQAQPAPNVQYSKQPAEQTNFPDNTFDLITCAQALHWFDLEKFHNEVVRVAKPGELICEWGYGACTISPEIDAVYQHFYSAIVGPYWDEARKLIETSYADLPFPFKRITTPDFSIEVDWTLDHFTGYLSSWSATQKFIRETKIDPVPEIRELLSVHWKDSMTVKFPLFVRLGVILK